jgi:hypothetical protein
MRRSPSIPEDRDVYLVLDHFGERLGRAWAETDEDRTDRQTVIRDLLDGQHSNPVRVVAFNIAEGWSRDVSEVIADELARPLTIEGREVPPSLQDFLNRHGGRPAQLLLPLRSAA